MNWYNWQRAPFGEGKKRKEFPDAIVMLAISIYAKKNNVSVAMVSKDKDFEKHALFTMNYSIFLPFQQLPRHFFRKINT